MSSPRVATLMLMFGFLIGPRARLLWRPLPTSMARASPPRSRGALCWALGCGPLSGKASSPMLSNI
eukprot:8406305-Alexandrium_andersonii.AAC.1